MVLSPLLYGSCPDYRHGLLPHVDAPYSGWHQSSAIQNRAHQPEFPAVFPRSPCHAICGTADTRYPISRRTAVNPATVLLCVKSKTRIDKAPVILGYSAPLPSLSWQMRFQQAPYRIADVVALLFILHGNTSFGSLAPIIPYRSCKHYLVMTQKIGHITPHTIRERLLF